MGLTADRPGETIPTPSPTTDMVTEGGEYL